MDNFLLLEFFFNFFCWNLENVRIELHLKLMDLIDSTVVNFNCATALRKIF